MSWDVKDFSKATGRDEEEIWRDKAKPAGSSAIGKSAPIEVGAGELQRLPVDVKDKINPHDANLGQKVDSVAEVAERAFEQEMAEEMAAMFKAFHEEKSTFQGEIVDTEGSSKDDDFPELHPKLRPEPKWDGTLFDMKQRIQALHRVILTESKRFNQTQDQEEKAEIGKFLGHLFEDMDTWIHRFEEWKAAYDIPKAIQNQSRKNRHSSGV